MIIDFLNFTFFIALIVFCIIFFIFGDRFKVFLDIMRSIAPLSFFAFMFLLFLKKKSKLIARFKEEGNFDEVILYLTRLDRLRDFFVILSIALVNLIFSYFMRSNCGDDFVQIFILFTVMILWSSWLLKKDARGDFIAITIKKISNDEIFILLLPVISYITPYLTGGRVDMIDAYQSLIPLVIMYPWHYIFFQKGTMFR